MRKISAISSSFFDSNWELFLASSDLNAKEGPEEFEDIIESLGSFGHWQRVIFFVICLTDIFGSISVVIPVFIGAIPNFYAFESHNDTVIGDLTYNETAKNVCPSENNSYTVRKFHDDFTSIVSEVSCCYSLLLNLTDVSTSQHFILKAPAPALTPYYRQVYK